MPEQTIIATLVARGLDSFRSAMDSAKTSVEGVGQASKTAGADSEKGGRGFGGAAKSFAQATAGAYALKRGYDFMKGAANDASGLARNTAQLTRTTGMDTQAGSAWASIAKSRGIETAALNKSFVTLSKQMQGAAGGSKTAVAAFEKLGVSAEDLKSGNIDTQGVLLATADAFKEMPDGAEKAALAQQLFGRQGQMLLPILNQGSEGVEKQMTAMKNAGLTMDKSGVDKTMKLVGAQRELRTSLQGIRQSFGQAMIPVQLLALQALQPLVDLFAKLINSSPVVATAVAVLAGAFMGMQTVSKAANAVGQFSDALGSVRSVAGGVGDAIGTVRNAISTGWDTATSAVQGAAGAMKRLATATWGGVKAAAASTAAWIREKVALIAAKVATLAKAVATKIAAAAQWLWNAAMAANPLMLIVIAIVAVVAGLVLLYTKCEWFRNAVAAVWNAIKTAFSAVTNFILSNWKWLLAAMLGPVGIAVMLIIQNWGAIKGFFASIGQAIVGAFTAAWNWVKTAATNAGNFIRNVFNGVVGFFAGLPGRIGAAISGVVSAIVGVFKSAASSAWNQFTWLLDQIRGLPGKIVSLLGSLGSQIWEAIKGVLSGVIPGPLKKIFGLQEGGVLPPGGAFAIVGEAGPELLQLPGASQLRIVGVGGPQLLELPGRARVSPIVPLQAGTTPGVAYEREIHVHLEVDGRELTTAVARTTAEARARR